MPLRRLIGRFEALAQRNPGLLFLVREKILVFPGPDQFAFARADQMRMS
jgi:hypothetical protein